MLPGNHHCVGVESGSESSVSLPLSLGAHIGNPALLPLGRVLSYAMQDVLPRSENCLDAHRPDAARIPGSSENRPKIITI